MKKNLLLAVAGILAAQIATAQTQKGTQTLGGYLSFMHNSSDNSDAYSGQSSLQKNSITSFDLGPAYSVFLADKLELGGNFNFNSQTNKVTYTGVNPYNNFNQVSTSFGASVSLLKYFMYDKIGFRMGPRVGYSRGTTKINYSNQPNPVKTNNDNFNAGAKIDLVYYPSKSLGLAASLASLSYSRSKMRNADNASSSSSAEGFNTYLFTSNLTISAFYVFGNK